MCQPLSLQNDRESSCFLSCRFGEANVPNQPIGAEVLALCVYFGSAGLLAIQDQHMLLL